MLTRPSHGRAELVARLGEARFDGFFDRWIDAVEARQLAFGGGGGVDMLFEGFVTRLGRGSASEDDREAMRAFLANDADVIRHQVGPLIDA